MEFKAKDIAALLNGVVEGDPEISVHNVSKIEEGEPGTMAFLANPKYENYIYTTQASIVLVNDSFIPAAPLSCTLIRVASAYDAFATLLQMYDAARPRPVGIEQPSFIGEGTLHGEDIYIGAFAYIGKGVKLGNRVKIYPNSYIGDGVKIGDNTVIHAGVKVYHHCVVGADCIIHAGAVIGADGFGFAPEGERYKKVPQIGNVVIGDSVEIGANTCIDRATMGSTEIHTGVKLNNLIQIAHNVVIGKDTAIAAQTGVAGTAKLGEHCVVGGQVGIVGHIHIGSGTKIAAQSGINSNIPENAILLGSPAFDLAQYRRSYVLFKRLPELYGQIRELEKEIKNKNK